MRRAAPQPLIFGLVLFSHFGHGGATNVIYLVRVQAAQL